MKSNPATASPRRSARSRAILVALAVVAAAAIAYAYRAFSERPVSLSELAGTTHFHGIAVDPEDPSRLYLATHHGFYIVSPDGKATRLSEAMDMMGFTPFPFDPRILYASGHPAGGGNLGFMMSDDGGKSWKQLSKGVGGPVDFHQIDASKANMQTIYGAYGGIQVSRNGGLSWSRVGPQPEGLIALATSAQNVDTLYAATQTGLLVSKDGGKSWQPIFSEKRPVSTIFTTRDGDVYVFVVGSGLLHAKEPALAWQSLGSDFGGAYVLHLAVDPTNKERLYAVTNKGSTLASRDGGRTWATFGKG